MKKKVCHYRWSSIALAPDEIVKAINTYSDKYISVLYIGKNEENVTTMDRALIDPNVPVIYNEDVSAERFDGFDLVHCHNLTPDVNVPCIAQFHSPPGTPMNLAFKGTKLVIAQYHATLPIYNGFNVVRNIIDYNDDMYATNYNINKIKIGYSPSVKSQGGYTTKGYEETVRILETLKRNYPEMDYDVIFGVPLNECIQRKSQCNILIDECVTDSYHRCTLESMALGKMTICSISKDVMAIVHRKTNNVDIPVENIWVHRLEKFLEEIIRNNQRDEVIHKGKLCRQWMETYWNPKDIIEQDFEPIYDKELENDSK